MARASVEVLAALFEEHKKQMAAQHEENKRALAAIAETQQKTLEEQRITNGRVTRLEARQSPTIQRDWKEIGAGIGALFFGAWGVVEAIRLLLTFVGKVGSTVVGK